MIIEPFSPWIYKGEIADFVSPPFDTISKEEEIKLKHNKDNITNLTLPESYEKATEFLKNLKLSGKLEREEESIVIITMEYVENGKIFTVPGIISLIDSTDKNIVTHEKTFQKFVDDRINLMKNIGGQPEPIFVVSIENLDDILFEYTKDVRNKIIFDFNFNGIRIKAYLVKDPERIIEIQMILKEYQGIIADGHHRFAASKQLYESTKDPRWKMVMAFIVSLNSKGLKISGVHRVVKDEIVFHNLMDCVSRNFLIKKIEKPDDNSIVIYKKYFYQIVAKNPGEDLIESLPVSLVNSHIFKECLKMDDRDISNHVEFMNCIDQVVKMVDSDVYSFGIIMPSTDKIKFLQIVKNKLQLPQKSTYFNPKIPSGIVMNLF